MPTVVVSVAPPQVVVDSGPMWTDVVSAVGTIAALLLAALAIVITMRQGRETDKMIADQHQAVSELEVLRDLMRQGMHYHVPSSPNVRGLLDCLPKEDLPVWRKCAEIEDQYGDVRPKLEEWLTQREPRRHQNFDRWVALAMADDVRKSMTRRVQPIRSARRRWPFLPFSISR
jgi:hypothetical protein